MLLIPLFGNAQETPHENKGTHSHLPKKSSYSSLLQKSASVTADCSTYSSTVFSVCSSAYPVNWNGISCPSEGTYTYQTLNSKGCDSFAILNLYTKPATASSQTVTACNSFSWNGTTYAQSGIYTYSTTGISGCDSMASLVLTINKFTANEIYGPVSTCAFTGALGNEAIYSIGTEGAAGFTWNVPPSASILSGQGTSSIHVKYASTFSSGLVKVVVYGNCGSAITKTLTVAKSIPETPSFIYGPTSACGFIGTSTPVTYSIFPVANALYYKWTLPAYVTLLSANTDSSSITVKFEQGFVASHDKSIKVKSISGCGNSVDKVLNILTTPPPVPGTIKGPDNACPYVFSGRVATYSITKLSNVSFYVWSVPVGVTILSHPGGIGANDTIINVVYDNSFVSLSNITVQSFTECGASNARVLTITRRLPDFPNPINGPVDVCSYVSTTMSPTAEQALYWISKIPYATSYSWSIPVGAKIESHPGGIGENDTCILVSFNSFFVNSGNIKVFATNDCGSSGERALSIKGVLPVVPPVILGPSNVCDAVFNGADGLSTLIASTSNPLDLFFFR